LYAAADAALYTAKNAGKDQSRRFDARIVDIDVARRRTTEATRLRAARDLADVAEIADRLRELPLQPADATHPQRVADLAARIAGRLGLTPSEVESVRLAARLHDVGKLSVPREILTKPSRLDGDEWQILQGHPELGHRLLLSLGADRIAHWVLHHHERWDGTGYPARLRSHEIPLEARILFVADAFDAMTSERPYRAALDVDAAVAELLDCSGTQFDPNVVAALVEELGYRGALRLEPAPLSITA